MGVARGWVVVAAAHIALFVAFGVTYSFAAFFAALQTEFGAARADVSLVFAISGFLYFLIGAFAGPVADRFGPRRVTVFGLVMLALGLAAAARAPSLSVLYVTYSVGVGVGVGCMYVPVVGAVQPWFTRRRSVASGVAVAGIGLGTLVVPLCAAWLIESFGWRNALDVMALGALVFGGIAVALVDNDPTRHGLGPDGTIAVAPMGDERGSQASPREASLRHAGPRHAPPGVLLRDALRMPKFWIKYAAIVCCSLGMFIPFVHLVPYARDVGQSERAGVLLMGLIGVGSLVGRFGLAGLGDRMPRAALHVSVYLGMAAMLAVWLGSSSVFALGFFALVFGAFYGGFVALQPALVMDYYGARNVAGIIGLLYTGAGVGNLLGPWLAGLAFDWQRSYNLPILVSIGFMLVAAALAQRLRRESTYESLH